MITKFLFPEVLTSTLDNSEHGRTVVLVVLGDVARGEAFHYNARWSIEVQLKRISRVGPVEACRFVRDDIAFGIVHFDPHFAVFQVLTVVR